MSRTSPSLQHLPSHPDQSRIRPPRHQRSVTMSTAAAVQAGEAATCRTRCCGTFWSRRVFIGGKTTSSSFNSILVVAAVHLFVLVHRFRLYHILAKDSNLNAMVCSTTF
ncbi:hypothetical protein ACQJBY_038619 [Aegilops geniculata]